MRPALVNKVSSLAFFVACLFFGLTLLTGCGPSYPLHAAIRAGNTDKALRLIERGRYINDIDCTGNAPLHWAALEGQVEVVRRLLDAGADADVRSVGTPLYHAAARGDVPVARLLLERGAKIDAKTADSVTALMVASYAGHVDMVSFLISQGADVNANFGFGTALSISAYHGHASVVKALLENGADVNITDSEQVTPVMDAGGRKHSDIVGLLIAKGADVNRVSSTGFTALMFAARENDAGSAKQLVNAGAEVNAQHPTRKFSCLDFAACNDNIETAEYLISVGAKSNYVEDAPEGLYAAAVSSKLLAKWCEQSEGKNAAVQHFTAAGHYYEKASLAYRQDARTYSKQITQVFTEDLVRELAGALGRSVVAAISGVQEIHRAEWRDTSDLSRVKKMCQAKAKQCELCATACRQIVECYQSRDSSQKTNDCVTAAKKCLGII